jgi:hypothetical protein
VHILKRKEISQINNLFLYLKLLEKQEHKKLKTNRREIIQLRVEINEIKTRKSIQRINKTKR